MLEKCPILVLEDDPYIALDLSSAIEELDGHVIGPASDADEALGLLNSRSVSAAIVDWHLPEGDASPVASWLSARRIPFVIHSTDDISSSLGDSHPDVPLLIKPLQPRTVVARLVVEIRKSARAQERS
jgi:DNA-binding response OmpR family regulator